MSPSHHIDRTRLYLNFAVRHTAEGDLDRAAQALARAVSHTATAIGNHWDLLVKARRTRRRLQISLDEMAYRGVITRSLAGVMREAYALPQRMAEAATAAPDAQSGRRNIIRLLRRTRTRARRLLRRALAAMAADPNPPTWNEILARINARAAARPVPSYCICHGKNPIGSPPCLLRLRPRPPAPLGYGAAPPNPLYCAPPTRPPGASR